MRVRVRDRVRGTMSTMPYALAASASRYLHLVRVRVGVRFG